MVGNDHYSQAGQPVLTLDQSRVQLSIWSIMASPLIMSNDLYTVPDDYRKLLLNADMIGVNQDVLGQPGWRDHVIPISSISGMDDGSGGGSGDVVEVWIRPLSGERLAICLYRPTSSTLSQISNDSSVSVDVLSLFVRAQAHVQSLLLPSTFLSASKMAQILGRQRSAANNHHQDTATYRHLESLEKKDDSEHDHRGDDEKSEDDDDSFPKVSLRNRNNNNNSNLRIQVVMIADIWKTNPWSLEQEEEHANQSLVLNVAALRPTSCAFFVVGLATNTTTTASTTTTTTTARDQV